MANDELVQTGFAEHLDRNALLRALDALRDTGADSVLISRTGEPALAREDDATYELSYPRFEALEPRGTSDSIFAALATLRAQGNRLGEGAAHSDRRGQPQRLPPRSRDGRRADIATLAERVAVHRVTKSQAG